MEQLSMQDASFVFMESVATPMQIGGLYIYDPSQSPNGEPSEDDVLRYYDERLHLAPMMRQKLVRVPMDADYPYWIADADFDLEYHVRRIALPKPADLDTLLTIAGRIFARPLDMQRPLWETHVIEGLDNVEGVPKGCFAVLTKMHHASVDGASGMQMIEILHDLNPNPPAVPPPATPWRPEPAPSDFELMARSSANHMMNPFRFAQTVARQMGDFPERVKQTLETLAGVNNTEFAPVPGTRFNGRVSPQRVVGGVRLPLETIRAARKVVPGATVNDAVLTICGGGLRRYLKAKNELDGDPLVAMAPVNLRGSSETASGGNQVSAMFIAIGTHIGDPEERLQTIAKATRSSKAISNAVDARAMTDYSRFVPAFTSAMAGRLISNLASVPQPPFNLTITNVPGPQVPLYFMGAPMVTSIGLGPLSHGMGLIMPITSYNGELAIAFTCCRDMMPDPDFFTACLTDSYEEFINMVEAA